jgi:hypothetical protein
MQNRPSQTSLLVLTAAFALLLVIGSQQGSAALSVFAPPPGWHRTVDIGNGLGVWVHSGDVGFDQNVNVLAQRVPGSLSEFTKASVAELQAKLQDVKFGAMQRTTVCGAHPATYLTYTATLVGKSLIYEQVMTIWRGTAYVATYTRMVNQPSLHEARASLVTLCGGAPAAYSRPSRYAAPSGSPTATPYLGPVASPQTYGSAAPTVTPRLGP